MVCKSKNKNQPVIIFLNILKERFGCHFGCVQRNLFFPSNTHLWHIAETVEKLLRLFKQVTKLPDNLPLLSLEVHHDLVVYPHVTHLPLDLHAGVEEPAASNLPTLPWQCCSSDGRGFPTAVLWLLIRSRDFLLSVQHTMYSLPGIIATFSIVLWSRKEV